MQSSLLHNESAIYIQGGATESDDFQTAVLMNRTEYKKHKNHEIL